MKTKKRQSIIKIYSVLICFISLSFSCIKRGNVRLSFDLNACLGTFKFLTENDISSLHPEKAMGNKLLIDFHKGECLTEEIFLDALKKAKLKHFTYEEKLKLKEVVENLETIRKIIKQLEVNYLQYSKEAVIEVLENIPGEIKDEIEYKVYIVLGGRADTYVVFHKGRPNLVLDVVSLIEPFNQGIIKSQIMASLNHELWHAVFDDFRRKSWNLEDPYSSKDILYVFYYWMLNEGYAHYMSLKAYGLDPTKEDSINFYNRLKEKEKILFDRFNRKIEYFLDHDVSEEAKRTLLHESHIGPFWEKWGAMTAAFIFYHLESSIGLNETIKSFKTNPYDYLMKYRELEIKYSNLPRLNDKFINKVQQLLDNISK